MKSKITRLIEKMLELNKIYCEDCRLTIDRMEDDSIDCLVTSPPYWALRDYGIETVVIWDEVDGCLHEWGEWFKDNNASNDSVNQFCQICGAWRGSLGLEPDFNLYIKHLVGIFELFRPKLKKSGTMWVNLGDTYFSRGKNKGSDIDYQSKSLCAIPDRFKIAMIDAGWICRNEIIWHKPSCIPASVKDRFTVDFEKLFFFTKSQDYYFEQQLEPYTKTLDRWGGDKIKKSSCTKYSKIVEPKLGKFGAISLYRKGRLVRPNDQGRNKRCVWTIAPKGTPENHFAVYPDKLIEIPIKAGCPERGIVYDPFGGSGTTADVCMRLNRNFIISEVSFKYVNEIAEKRIKELTFNF